MDNNTDNVLSVHRTVVRGPIGPHRDILELTARLKGRSVTTGEATTHRLEERRPDSSITITGFWPAIAYLDDRYPDPYLAGNTPIESAVIRSLVEELLIGDTDAPMLRILEAHSSDKYLVSNRPTLLDITGAIVARYTGVDISGGSRIWHDLYERLNSLAYRHKEARCT